MYTAGRQAGRTEDIHLSWHITSLGRLLIFCLTLAKENWEKQSCEECCPCRSSWALLRLQNRAAADQLALMDVKRDCISWNYFQTLCCILRRDRSTRILASVLRPKDLLWEPSWNSILPVKSVSQLHLCYNTEDGDFEPVRNEYFFLLYVQFAKACKSTVLYSILMSAEGACSTINPLFNRHWTGRNS